MQRRLLLVPSNMILSKVRPSWYLSACMVAWGIVSGASGAVQSFSGLAACRFFLGITEVRMAYPSPDGPAKTGTDNVF